MNTPRVYQWRPWLFVALLGIIGCAQPDTFLFRQVDSGSIIHISKGERFSVALEENATTGYRWEYVPAAGPELLRKIKDTYEHQGSRLGSGGMHTFSFQAVALGKTRLQIVHHRSWEKDDSEKREFILEIQIQ